MRKWGKSGNGYIQISGQRTTKNPNTLGILELIIRHSNQQKTHQWFRDFKCKEGKWERFEGEEVDLAGLETSCWDSEWTIQQYRIQDESSRLDLVYTGNGTRTYYRRTDWNAEETYEILQKTKSTELQKYFKDNNQK